MRHAILCVLTFVFFLGCSAKVDRSTLALSPQEKTYHTYNAQEAKISSYFFNTQNDELSVRSFITYIPFDTDDQLYSPFSSVKTTLDRHTNYKAKTIQEAMVLHMKQRGDQRLFQDKEEYLIDNDFARDLIQDIKAYNDKMDRDNNNESEGVIIIP